MTSENSERQDPALFDGAVPIYLLVGALYQRPRIGDRPRALHVHESEIQWKSEYQQERSGRRGLPMVCLVRPERHDGVLSVIRTLLEEAKPAGVLYARLDLAQCAHVDLEPGEVDANAVKAIRDILWQARNELIRNPKVRGGRLRFQRFTLVAWLMRQRLEPHDDNPDHSLRQLIQGVDLVTRMRSSIQQIDLELPDKFWWKVSLATLRLLTYLKFRAAVRGWLPTSPYRWFTRQPHLAPEMSGKFVRFARRLTEGEWEKEAPEYVARLLVNSFLEDLRQEYRIRLWQIFRARRMTYPVLLLDNIATGNGGFLLLRLINDVRNQVGLFDPLLIVSASSDVPPDAGRDDPSRPKYKASNAAQGYRAWQNALRDDRRARRDTAWYLPLRIPEQPSQDKLDQAREAWRAFDGYAVHGAAARPPWWMSRWLRIGVPLLLLTMLASMIVVAAKDHCGTSDLELTLLQSECVGVSDGSYNLFQPADQTSDQVVARIRELNLEAEQRHRANKTRPYITLVDMAAFTSSTAQPDGVTAERESLEGLAVAQARQLDAPGLAPIVRVLIANAGKGMRRGRLVAEQLGALAKRDPSIVGVVGLDMSSTATEDTIAALTHAGLPAVAATLSADELAGQSPMYFQVAPQNSREARVIASFADQRKGTPRTARIVYSSDQSDRYSSNLRQDLDDEFRNRNFSVDDWSFTPVSAGAEDAKRAGRGTCGFDGYVVFAGRGVPDFEAFLDGASQCHSNATLIGGDDVSRFVASSNLRTSHGGIPYYYVSFATVPGNSPSGLAEEFYRDLPMMFTFEGTNDGRSWDGHAALSFDAAQVLITATAYLFETPSLIPPTPGAVWREITAIHSAPSGGRTVNNHIEGATGTIDFGGDINRHVPADKPVAILRVEHGSVDRQSLEFCGHAEKMEPASWCRDAADG